MPARHPGRAPVCAGIATDYLAEVGEVIKGNLPGSPVVVRMPGGEMEEDLEMLVSGASGRSSLMPNRDGSYGVLHLSWRLQPARPQDAFPARLCSAESIGSEHDIVSSSLLVVAATNDAGPLGSHSKEATCFG